MAHQDQTPQPLTVAAADEHRIDRVVTAIALIATIGLIMLSPFA